MTILKAKVNGEWVPVSGGGTSTPPSTVVVPDEVWVGTDDPIATTPTVELWFDSDDEPAAADQANFWNSSWGVVGVQEGSNDIACTAAAQVLASVTFTAVAGRLYAASYQCVMNAAGLANNTVHMKLRLDGGATGLCDCRLSTGTPANQQLTISLPCDRISTTPGSHTVTATFEYPPPSYVTIQGSWAPWRLVVTDVGPVTKAAVNPPAGQPTIATAGNALGVVAIGPMFSGVTIPTPGTIVTSLNTPVACTLLVGRRYRISGQIRAFGIGSATAALSVGIYDNGVATNWMDQWASTPVNYNSVTFKTVIDGDGLSHLLDIRSVNSTPGLSVYGGPGCFFMVEDIGPNQAPALPIPETPPGWTAVTFQYAWRDFLGSYQTAQYRKIGDVVSVRGLVLSPTAPTGTWAVFILPVGFRPPSRLLFPTMAMDTLARVDVFPDGTVAPVAIAGAPANWYSYLNLNFSFSVTA